MQVGGLLWGKNLPFDSLTTYCVQQKYWVLAPWLHFFSPLVRWDFWNTTFQAMEAKWESLTCTFSSREEIIMIDVIFQETASKKNTWSENVTYYRIAVLEGGLGFKNSKRSFWRLDKTLRALTKWQQKKLRSDFSLLEKKNTSCILVCPQRQTAGVIYTYCTAAGVSWQHLSTCCSNEIQDVSPSTMNPS